MELDPKKLGKVDEKVRWMARVIKESCGSLAERRVLRLALLDITEAVRELRTSPPDCDRANNEVPVMYPEE